MVARLDSFDEWNAELKQECWALAIDLFMHVAMEKQVPSVSARFDGSTA